MPQLETIDWNFPVTVEQVVMMGRTTDSALFPWYRRSDREVALTVMERLGIADLARRHIRELSGGQQQMLSIGRALMARPRLLLLDEPSLGLAPLVVEEVFESILEINRRGTAVFLAEQNAHAALKVAKRGYVIESGSVAIEGDRDTLVDNPEVRRAYIGV